MRNTEKNANEKLITKTRLYNFDPLKPHFYIVKLGFTGIYIIFLTSAQKQRLWVLVRTASSSTHTLCFEPKFEKYQNFLSENYRFLVVNFLVYLYRRVFVMIIEGSVPLMALRGRVTNYDKLSNNLGHSFFVLFFFF